jgi:hypothetical protein
MMLRPGKTVREERDPTWFIVTIREQYTGTCAELKKNEIRHMVTAPARAPNVGTQLLERLLQSEVTVTSRQGCNCKAHVVT